MRKIVGLTILFALTLPSAFSQAKEPELSTRLIISVDEPLYKEGGAVIISGRQVSDDEWRAIAADAGPKDAHEKEFHIRVSSPASIVDFVYPESGTYSFKLQSPSGSDAKPLKTRQILIGSAEVTDPETKKQVSWPSMSVIHVEGTTYNDGWARILSSTFDLAFTSEDKAAVSIQRFPAGRVLSLSQSAIETFVRDSE
ncbi:hypothetical protein O8B93_25700 [Agrobacterium rhizogenes]|uniref:hypothetical protein n=1 Tax=Rhizobium rhizogenes TaxID=359 RepID=UPI0022B73998|nr:hypothetical protein [Rhizobium rhizogenes]MCZ7450972.1 hypothetical protein [Rhizobium rhizogenes]